MYCDDKQSQIAYKLRQYFFAVANIVLVIYLTLKCRAKIRTLFFVGR
jgi:hypothetical protein